MPPKRTDAFARLTAHPCGDPHPGGRGDGCPRADAEARAATGREAGFDDRIGAETHTGAYQVRSPRPVTEVRRDGPGADPDLRTGIILGRARSLDEMRSSEAAQNVTGRRADATGRPPCSANGPRTFEAADGARLRQLSETEGQFRVATLVGPGPAATASRPTS